jgi:hypothetical protein
MKSLTAHRRAVRAERAWPHEMFYTAASEDADVPGAERSVITADDHTD